MRWISLCTVLAAALLPAASARPLCRHDPSTTVSLPATIETSATLEPSTTRSATETASETLPTTSLLSTTAVQFTSTTPSSGFLTSTLTATTESAISTDSVTVTTAPTTTASESVSITTAEASSTASETAQPTNLVSNGDFEEGDLDWNYRTGEIVEDASKANSGSYYANLEVIDDYATGGNQINQTINGLDTTRLFRLSFSLAVFDTPDVGDATCVIEAMQQDPNVLYSWELDYTELNTYKSYSVDFSAASEDITLTLRLRCTSEDRVTIDVGIDDVAIYDIGALE